jgi:hypothetical protein
VDRLAGVRLLLRPVLRDREDELFVDRPLDEDERAVLELRDPGGEDVRVAMVRSLCERHTSHRDHTGACRRGTEDGEVSRTHERVLDR